MKICFLILAHEHPDKVARLAKLLLSQGGSVVLHIDRKVERRFTEAFRKSMGARFAEVVWARSVRVAWGEWSMIEATLNGLRAVSVSGLEPSYVHLMSGADYPLRGLDQLTGFLDRNAGKEFIESVDAERFRWVKHGYQEDRYRFRHWVSFRRSPALHTWSVRLQRLFGLSREFPSGYRPHLGSQWWTLTWATCRAILDRAEDHRLVSFFRTTAVPDELFFQTLVRAVVGDEGAIDGRHLTLYEFSDHGFPIVYYNDHEEYLLRQRFLFARKISPYADKLRDTIDARRETGSYADGLEDGAFGTLPTDYRCFALTHGHGLFGRRSMGRVKDAWYGDLEWNALGYFAVVGDSRQALTTVQAYLNGLGGILCHGELFRYDRIEFANGAERCAGYSAGDIAIRDHMPQNFLVDLIHESPDFFTGFVVHLGDVLGDGPPQRKVRAGWIPEVVAWDPNCAFILVRTDPVDQFFRDFGSQVLADRSDAYVSELFGGFYQEYLKRDDYATLAEAARQSGAPNAVINLGPRDTADKAWGLSGLNQRLLAKTLRQQTQIGVPRVPAQSGITLADESGELMSRIYATIRAVDRRCHRLGDHS